MKKLLLMLALAAVLAAGLTGCSDKSSEPDSSAAESESSSESSESSAAEPESEADVSSEEEKTTRTEEDIYNSEMVEKLLDTISAGVTDNNGFFTQIEQKYKLGYKEETENESTEFYVDTHANAYALLNFGQKGASEADNDKSLYDMMLDGEGYLQTDQEEKTELSYKSVSKTDIKNEVSETKKYEADASLVIKADDKDIYVQDKTVYTDLNDSKNSTEDSFNGKVSKKDYLGIVSEQYIEKTRQDILFLDTWDYIAQFCFICSTYKESLDLNDPSAVDAFMKDNDISITDDKEVGVTVSFNIKTDEMFSALTGEEVKNAPKVSGRIVFDKDKGELLIFEYDFKDYFKFLTELSADGKEVTELSVEDYYVKGISLSFEDHDIEISGKFTEYDDPASFLEEMDKHLSVMSNLK